MLRNKEIELRRKVGDFNSLYGIKSYVLDEGKARGVKAYDLNNGQGLNATVFVDRGMDIPFLSYKGVNIGLLTKSGISSPFSFTESGLYGFMRQFNGGFLTTCGVTYSGSPAVNADGHVMGLHGVYSNIIAENVNAYRDYAEDGEAVLHIDGEVRQAMMFRENVRVYRKLAMHTESNILELHDVIENLGFERQPLMMVYHCNFGYPMLDAGAECYFTAHEVKPLSPFAEEGLAKKNVVEEPEDGRDEQCYLHSGAADDKCFGMLYNRDLGLAVAVHYDQKQCPFMVHWKMMGSGNYALGLEPTVCTTGGQEEAMKNGYLPYLEPGEKYSIDVTFEVITDPERIQHLIDKSKG